MNLSRTERCAGQFAARRRALLTGLTGLGGLGLLALPTAVLAAGASHEATVWPRTLAVPRLLLRQSTANRSIRSAW